MIAGTSKGCFSTSDTLVGREVVDDVAFSCAESGNQFF